MPELVFTPVLRARGRPFVGTTPGDTRTPGYTKGTLRPRSGPPIRAGTVGAQRQRLSLLAWPGTVLTVPLTAS